VCSATAMDKVNSPPATAWALPVLSKVKQKGD
jgi:hypothetical protein